MTFVVLYSDVHPFNTGFRSISLSIVLTTRVGEQTGVFQRLRSEMAWRAVLAFRCARIAGDKGPWISSHINFINGENTMSLTDEIRCFKIATILALVLQIWLFPNTTFDFRFTWPADPNTTSTCKVVHFTQFHEVGFLENFEPFLRTTQWNMTIIHIIPFVPEWLQASEDMDLPQWV